MELRTLRYYLAAADEENITRAADILHITQPTLSRQIMDLERELGTTLMTRGKKRPDADRRRHFLPAAGAGDRGTGGPAEKKLCRTSEYDQRHDRDRGFRSGRRGDAGRTHQKVSSRYPSVQFTLYNETVDNIKDRLDKGLVDIGLLLEPVDVARYDYVRLSRQDTWGLLVRDDHPLTGKKSLTAEDVAPYPLILPLRESIRAEILHWLGREEKELAIPLFYTLLSNAALLVAEGLGCAFCMDGALAIRSDPRLRFIPLEPRRMTHSVLVWKKNHLFSPAASLFIQEINLLRAQME